MFKPITQAFSLALLALTAFPSQGAHAAIAEIGKETALSDLKKVTDRWLEACMKVAGDNFPSPATMDVLNCQAASAGRSFSVRFPTGRIVPALCMLEITPKQPAEADYAGVNFIAPANITPGDPGYTGIEVNFSSNKIDGLAPDIAKEVIRISTTFEKLCYRLKSAGLQ